MRTLGFLAFSTVILAACSVTVAGPTVPTGNVAGHALNVQEMLASWDGPPQGPRSLKLFFSESPGTCAAFTSSRLLPGMSGVGVDFRKVGSAAKPVTTGTFNVVFDANETYPATAQVDEVVGQFLSLDQSCGDALKLHATTGTITLTSVTDSDVVGTVSLAFPNGESVSGPFHASICALPSSPRCG